MRSDSLPILPDPFPGKTVGEWKGGMESLLSGTHMLTLAKGDWTEASPTAWYNSKARKMNQVKTGCH